MAKPNATENQTQTWGTWEELLLACAVHRYGTKSWDSVAIEIQKRSSNLKLLTAQTCKQKFQDLKRRFMDQNDDVSEHDDDDDDDKTIHTIPWLDELRKLRVAELKREVERYDLSIVSLQLKVKRLKEEREQSTRENEKEREKSDLEKSVEKDNEEENNDGDGQPDKSSPESSAGKLVAGEDSYRDNQSVNESNSTDPKGEHLETGPEEAEEKPEPVKQDAREPAPVGECTKPAGEDSFNGSSDTIAKESAASPVENSEKADPARESGDSPELWESVAESKGGAGEEGTKENSDVQSSVKSQPENEDQSPAIKPASVKSHPLVDFLEIIRSHRLGSIFERRLESQETTEYTTLIRQHIDLETVRTRLEEGWYSGYNRKFFRDLLLLFNNAMVFFGYKSSESMAAIELRQLISKEMARNAPKFDPSPQEQIPIPPPPPPPPPPPMKPDPEPSDSLLAKQKISGPMIACRKRSSIAAKASATSSGAERKREQTGTLVEEKPVLNWKQHDKSSVDTEEHRVTKKRTRERFTSSTSARNSTKNGKNRTNTNTNTNKNSDTNSNENSEPKMDKKNKNNATTSTNAKRRSAANFLSRMKRGSSSNNGLLLDTLKSSGVSSENSKGGLGGGVEHKKNVSSRSDARKEQASRKGSGGKQAKEQGSPAKRSVGRPPKRAAAPPPLPPPVLGKRSREAGETEAVASRQAKKRSRK